MWWRFGSPIGKRWELVHSVLREMREWKIWNVLFGLRLSFLHDDDDLMLSDLDDMSLTLGLWGKRSATTTTTTI